MADKLYYEDAYLKSFNAKVVSCELKKGCYMVVLDRTGFFPSGGGQSSDTGYIAGISVVEVREEGGEIYHITNQPLTVGDSVECSVDFDARFEKMQMHTAEHIISGIIHKSFGFNNVGFHLGGDCVTLDIDGILTREQLDFVENLANRAVFENIPVICRFILPEEINSLEYRSKLELTKDVRVVTIEGYDSCACCAPHVKSTGEIGLIKLLDFIKYKGGVRITMLAGWRALKDYRAKFHVLQSISCDLSAPSHECDREVKRVLSDSQKKDFDIKSLKLDMAKLIASLLKPTDSNALVFHGGFSHDELRAVASLAIERVGGILIALSGEENNYKYVIASNTVDLKLEIQNINKALSGKGGGRPEMAQGSFYCSLEQIKSYFKV